MEFRKHASEIVSRFINISTVSNLRASRAAENDERRLANPDIDMLGGEENPTEGDMVFENACLFLQDALFLYLFNDAIKHGDSGHIIIILKVFALGYRGSGRTKYAIEALHVIHNLAHLWPKPLR